jgi:hypothetical protein
MNDFNLLLRREQAAAFLSERGFKTSPKTLASMATRGGGPRFRRFGRFPVYTPADLLRWAEARLGPVVASTAELDHARKSASVD